MATNWRPNATADQAELDCTDYLRALGWFVLPVANYSKNGAPILRGEASALVQPDTIAMRKGEMRAFECKWKQKAIPRRNFGGRPYTGVDGDCYRRYRDYEAESGHTVTLVFLHENENEVRCATLWDLDRNAHDSRIDCTQEQYPASKGGMRNYWYDEIPLWVSYGEMKRHVAEFRRSGRAEWPSARPTLRDAPAAVAPVPIPQHPQMSFLNVDVSIPDTDRGGMHQNDERVRRRR